MEKQKKSTFLKHFFSSANLALILLIILVFFLINLGRESIKYFSTKKDIADIEAEIKRLEDKNLELTTSIGYLQSNFYKEKEAREKLGLKKPDEKVIVIMPAENSANSQKSEQKIEVSNLIKWWNYFFK